MDASDSKPARHPTRRRFLRGAASLAVSFSAAEAFHLLTRLMAAESKPAWRAAIIGHTGKGNYGHGLDVLFAHRHDVEVVAVADADASGLAKAKEKTKALRAYANYREMLAKEKPQLVSVAPRWTEEHHAMGMAVLQAGAHLLIEKPIATSLTEADELLATADKAGLRIVCTHQMQMALNIRFFKKAIGDGLLGDLLEIRAYGKQDKRAGGEDMLVLGTHLFDLVRLFAGDPLWCTARVLQRGHDITFADAHPATEGIGLVAGDEVSAQFAFANGVNATFTSRARNAAASGPWGLELIGSKATARILADIPPKVFLLQKSTNVVENAKLEWQRWDNDAAHGMPAPKEAFAEANARVVDEWIRAIEERREPLCSGRNALKAVEMVMAVYEAALSAKRVPFPLAHRQHPLTRGD